MACTLLMAAACTRADVDFGSQYLDNDYTRIISVDTFAPQVSTVYLDSFITGESGRGIVGIYKDPYFGLVKAQSYFEIVPPTYITNTDYAGTTVDSFVLILNTDTTYYGDTSKNLTLRVYQLLNNITYVGNNTEFYNVDTLALNTFMGEKTFIYAPHKTKTISIRLVDELGEALLQQYRLKTTYVQSGEAFVNYFKGLAVTATGTNAFVFGMKDSITMRIYYREHSATPKDSTIDFTLNNISHQFNNITVDRTGTLIDGISSKNRLISSTLTGNAGYLQSITGTAVKISFPNVRDLLKIPGYTKLGKAVLIVRPVHGSFDGLYYLPDSLRLSETNLYNKIGADLNDGNTYGGVQYGNLNIDDLYGRNTYYTYDITNYLQTQLATNVNNENGLIISPPTPGFDSKFYRMLVGDAANKSNIELQLYYLSIQ